MNRTENIVLRREVENLKTAIDMKRVLKVSQKTIDHLSEGLGKAKREA